MHQDDGARSSIKIFANIFISFIGAGILGMPHAFKEVRQIVAFVRIRLLSNVDIATNTYLKNEQMWPSKRELFFFFSARQESLKEVQLWL